MKHKHNRMTKYHRFAAFWVGILLSMVIGGMIFDKEVRANAVDHPMVDPYVMSYGEEPEKKLTAKELKLSDAVVKTIEIVFGKEAESAKIVASCESSKNPHAKSNKSTATGVFQIIKGTWEGYKCQGDRENAFDNIVCAKRIYDAQGGWSTSGGWEASAHCHKQP